MKAGLDGTHRGWLTFQFSYCSENCIAIGCCSTNHLPTVSCDPIMQWATRSARMVAEAFIHYHPPPRPGDPADAQRRCFCANEQGGANPWCHGVNLRNVFFSYPFSVTFPGQIWIDDFLHVCKNARFGSIIINDKQGYFPSICYVSGSEVSASYTLSLLVSITLSVRDYPLVSVLPFFLITQSHMLGAI